MCLSSDGTLDLFGSGLWSIDSISFVDPFQLNDYEIFNENFDIESNNLINQSKKFHLNSPMEAGGNSSPDLSLEHIDLESFLSGIPAEITLDEEIKCNFSFVASSSESSNQAVDSLNSCSYLDYESSTYSVSSISETESRPNTKQRNRSSTDTDSIKRVGKAGRVDKKESNKAAAVRYRCKKALEKDRLFAECEIYEKKNSDIKEKIGDLENEIDFIKNLLVQAFLAKNQNTSSLCSMISF